jgi:histidyl-tRNA synthetase
LGLIAPVRTPAAVIVVYFDQSHLHDYLQIAGLIRAAGIGVEVYPEAKKIGNQLKYADQRGFQVAIVAGAEELQSGRCQVKNLATKQSDLVTWRDNPDQLLRAIKQTIETYPTT